MPLSREQAGYIAELLGLIAEGLTHNSISELADVYEAYAANKTLYYRSSSNYQKFKPVTASPCFIMTPLCFKANYYSANRLRVTLWFNTKTRQHEHTEQYGPDWIKLTEAM